MDFSDEDISILPKKPKPTIIKYLDEFVHIQDLFDNKITVKKSKRERHCESYESRLIYPSPNQFRILATESKIRANFRHMNSGNNACVPICILFLHWIFRGSKLETLLERSDGYIKAGILLWKNWFEQSKSNDRNVSPKDFIDYLNASGQNEMLDYVPEECDINTNLDPEIVKMTNTSSFKFLTLEEIFTKFLNKSGDSGILVIHDSSKLVYRTNDGIFLFDSHGSKRTKKSDRCFFIILKDEKELVNFIEDLYFSEEKEFNIASFTKIRKKERSG